MLGIYKKNYFGIIVFIFSYLTLLFSFFLNEDGSGSGASGDFFVTYGFVLSLEENILSDPKDWTIVHTPLHFIILSLFSRLIENSYDLRLFFCSFSFLIPLFFYKALKLRFKSIDDNVAIITSSSILILVPLFFF